MEREDSNDSSGEHDGVDDNFTIACLVQSGPMALRITWTAKDGWSGREEDQDERPQRMLALASDFSDMWLEGYLFDEPTFEPKQLQDALATAVWVRRAKGSVSYRRISIKEEECTIRNEGDASLAELKNFLSSPPLFTRVRGDRIIQYGDGGMSRLFYPLVVSTSLPLSSSRRALLRQDLLRVAQASPDCHGDAKHIHDIIDPDLNPLMLDKKKMHDDRLAELRKISRDDDRHQNARSEIKSMLGVGHSVCWDALKLRKSYRWIPADFVVRSSDGSVNIVSAINGLRPSQENKALYQNLAQVFRHMLPMFEEVGLKLNKEGKDATTHLQVVVKAQQYVMPPRSSYSGKWHKEGMDEEIAWAGVYYVDVEEGLEGGDLKFQPQEPPDEYYREEMIDPSVLVPTKTGVAAVFCNVLPHRFRRIVNRSDKPLRRLFVNFFVFNPANRAPTAEVQAAGRMEVVWSLKQACPALPKDIVKYILAMLPNMWPSMKEARRFREEARKAMSSRKVGWGYIHWGNCGTLRFMTDMDCDHAGYLVSRDGFKHSDSGASDTVDDNN